jgi:PEP-CTERM motif
MKKILLTLATSACALAYAQAGSVTVEDFTATAYYPNSSTLLGNSTISAIWGTYSSGVFTPLLANTQQDNNTGYFVQTTVPANKEFTVTFTQSDNTSIIAGTQMFVSIYNIPGGASFTTWTSSTAQVVLTDPTWLAPTFTVSTPALTWSLTANTTAQTLSSLSGSGSSQYNYNAGAPKVTLVPEPSTYALLGMSALALGGYVVRRRRA